MSTDKPRYALMVPVTWFDTARVHGRGPAHGVVENPETGELTVLTAVFNHAYGIYPSTWTVNGMTTGSRPRHATVSVSESTLDSLRREGRLTNPDGPGCPVMKPTDLCRVDDPPSPLPRWA